MLYDGLVWSKWESILVAKIILNKIRMGYFIIHMNEKVTFIYSQCTLWLIGGIPLSMHY